jgi:hypothetical protein
VYGAHRASEAKGILRPSCLRDSSVFAKGIQEIEVLRGNLVGKLRLKNLSNTYSLLSLRGINLAGSWGMEAECWVRHRLTGTVVR